MTPHPVFRAMRLLKKDLMGTVEEGVLEAPGLGAVAAVRRTWSAAPIWVRPIAWILARRESAALRALAGEDRVPALLTMVAGGLIRSFIAGRTMFAAGPADPRFYAAARGLLRAIHRRGVTHNDTHKEANWLVTPDGGAALVDYQLAACHRRRGRWFRLCRLEDLRHLLKHKRTYCATALTARERALLATKSWPARWWAALVKPPYLLVTRRLFNWRDQEGSG